ncbi:hypothetical protein FN846DRAFT_657306 [Sphaerosporella brunnea]|uniref:Secreted protein n=1 Tax=Sphaerosporella brunnea TaxID=1250544 RepID=A0A5J5EC51_9PEZI|nr:hypothetical protein FN846DRAFT_657306 [Sphaerosporella brunnea]
MRAKFSFVCVFLPACFCFLVFAAGGHGGFVLRARLSLDSCRVRLSFAFAFEGCGLGRVRTHRSLFCSVGGGRVFEVSIYRGKSNCFLRFYGEWDGKLSWECYCCCC